MNEEKRLDGLSFDNVHARIEELKRMFPEAVKEGRLDYDTFMALLGDEFDNDREKYDFTWKGKLDSLKLAQRRSNGTLRPDLEQSRDWDTTGNLYLEGDNLEVMKLLQQGYLRSVKMIYIDPPYNTGNDFVYEDDFADPIAKYKEATGQGMRANPETAGRYHSRWLSMIYPRLKIAKTLLRDDGFIFISIDSNEVHNMRKLCDEVFGEENFIADILWQRRTAPDARLNLGPAHDYILVYSRKIEEAKDTLNKLPLSGERVEQYKNPDNDPRGPWASVDMTGQTGHATPSQFYTVTTPSGIEYPPPTGRCWALAESTFNALAADNRIWFGADGSSRPRQKKFLSEGDGGNIWTWWTNSEVGHNQEAAKEAKELLGSADIFDNPKPTRLLKRILMLSTTSDSLVMDFFSGSGTLANSVIALNAEDGGHRKFVCIQIPEPVDPDGEAAKAGFKTIADIGKERIRRAGDKILAEWQEKHDDRLPLGEAVPTPPDIGFRVFRLDSSNWMPWDNSFVSPDEPDLFVERLKAHLDNAKPDRRDIDVVYEVFLKYGVALTEKLSILEIEGKRFYVVGESGYMFICLDKNITVEVVEAAAKYNPGTMIFADECFADNTELTNAALVLEKVGIEFRWI